jgi:hypothetical protein
VNGKPILGVGRLVELLLLLFLFPLLAVMLMMLLVVVHGGVLRIELALGMPAPFGHRSSKMTK